ncbi:hypothetical protein PV328_005137 [Microctonus aethiopoides]|uniref:Cilia- and flagella-associated protein 300 n=1 Tax=Microctonus aethiopoides TaxID=144406 RepID=A0AA39FLB4_9HYME|nr:hypothetical protein PV328_005137 [Microctonus aethiopoides]
MKKKYICWGIKLQIQQFLFNETFHQYHKYDLAKAFFKDRIVANNLKTWTKNSYTLAGLIASDIEIKQIPCSITSMAFFDKLKDSNNNIVNDSDHIRQRFDIEIDGILVSNNLRGMLLDTDCDEYNLYSKDERDEFIFRLLQLLVLGGEYCQYEDNLNPYLEVTKSIYKDLVRVRKDETDNMFISTMVLQVVAKKEYPYFPINPDHPQNVGFLLVDETNREIITFLHQYGGF